MIEPREAVRRMAPYHPPSAGREGKLRLDFNENTVGCSPAVIEFLREHLTASQLSIYPEYVDATRELAEFFGVTEDEFRLTNGTDEAIQVLVNTFVDDSNEVVVLKPSYAMYRFYAEVAGATVREVGYQPETLAFPMGELLAAITTKTRAVLIANPNNPTGTAIGLEEIRKLVEHETDPDAAQAAEDWERVTKQYGARSFSAKPSVNLRPTVNGLEVVVRYITRAPQRNAMKSKLFQVIVDLMHKPSGTEARA